MEVFFHHNRLSVEVDDIGFGADDGGFWGLYDFDFRGFVHHAINHVAAHDGQFQRVGFLHDTEVNLAITQRGMRREE